MSVVPVATEYPLCLDRGILVGLGGTAFYPRVFYPRVTLTKLFASFNRREWAIWDRSTIQFEADERGIKPAQVEEFLSTLPPRDSIGELPASDAAQPSEASEMATVAKPRKKRAAKKSGKSVGMSPKAKRATKKADASLGAAGGDPIKNDPAQPPLPGMEEDRVPAIERAIKKVLDKRNEAKAAKEAADMELAKLPALLHKHDLATYKCLGRVVVIEPGADVVKIKKVKDK